MFRPIGIPQIPPAPHPPELRDRGSHTTDGTAAFFLSLALFPLPVFQPLNMNIPPIPHAPIPGIRKRAKVKFITITVLLLITGMVVYLNAAWVSAMVRDISPGCIFRKFTGIACPGCGGTRAARALVAGDMVRAFQYNFLLPMAVAGLLLEYTRLGIMYFSSREDWRNKRWYRLYFIIFAWMVPVWFILRNVLGV